MRILILLALTATAAAAGCNTNCTDQLVWSAEVDVVSADGGAIEDARVTFTAGDLVDEPCESWQDESGEFICGREIEGPITIQVSADGFASETLELDIDADRCHVLTQQATVELSPLAD